MQRLLSILSSVAGKRKLTLYITLGLVSGLLNFLFIQFITKIISQVVGNKYDSFNYKYLLSLAAIIAAFTATRKILSFGIIRVSQTIFWQLRRQILETLSKANYEKVVNRKLNIHTAIINDVDMLTQASLNVINFATSIILCIGCSVYLAAISLLLFSITATVAALTIFVYFNGMRRILKDFELARSFEDAFLKNFNDILGGFKEIILEPLKGDFINSRIKKVSNDAYKTNVLAYGRSINNQIVGQLSLYALVSAILVWLSLLLDVKPSNTVSFIFTLLYLLGAIETLMAIIPSFLRAKVASQRIFSLIHTLDDFKITDPVVDLEISKENFLKLEIIDVAYKYSTTETGSFSINSINLDVHKGSIIFVNGGNGSGKTTLINTILGLFIPCRGQIKINNILIEKKNYHGYRRLFSVVFSDFYLFDSIIIDNLGEDKCNYYLELFELKGKVTMSERRFSTVDLSTGQKKRLALISALLENKPFLVMDEWAADQDPAFKKKFYKEILPLLKNEGYSIIAITHDDKYYDCADQIFRMENGLFFPDAI